MNADLLAMLGGGMPGASSSRSAPEGKTLLSFKAGKMNAELQSNGKFMISPDPRRGEIQLVWQSYASGSGGGGSSGGGSGAGGNGGLLKFEWKDRRTRSVVDSLSIFPEDDCTYGRVSAGRDADRVYLLQFGGNNSSGSSRRFFFWMQDGDVNADEDNCVKVNLYMTDASAAARAASGNDSAATGTSAPTSASSANASMDDASLMRQIVRGLGNTDSSAPSAGSASSSSNSNDNSSGSSSVPANSGSSAERATPASTTTAGQVDALSNILQNLGMPRNRRSQEGEPAPAPAAAAARRSGTLTLADLRGAMANLTTPATPPGPPLAELASPDNVLESGILDNGAFKEKLLELLPEGQRTDAMLMENLRSPQVSQTLTSLTSALMPDGKIAGPDVAESFASIVANFNLDPKDGSRAMNNGNPIQAFLDAVLASVEREKKEAEESKQSEDEKTNEDEKMDESG